MVLHAAATAVAVLLKLFHFFVFFFLLQAGHAFALALTSEGEVLGWGRNDQGQLGLGGGLTMDVYAAEVLPRTIDALVDEKVRQKTRLSDPLSTFFFFLNGKYSFLCVCFFFLFDVYFIKTRQRSIDSVGCARCGAVFEHMEQRRVCCRGCKAVGLWVRRAGGCWHTGLVRLGGSAAVRCCLCRTALLVGGLASWKGLATCCWRVRKVG